VIVPLSSCRWGTGKVAPLANSQSGRTERFFAYWAWNLGESGHRLNAKAPIGRFGSEIANLILDIVTISSIPPFRC
jgi:hypothetical protein